MPTDAFPDPATFEFPEWVAVDDYLFRAHDVISFGTPLTAKNVREAYLKGIFPWYTDGLPLPWHCPEYRAILDFDELNIPRSLTKSRRKNEFTFTIDAAFDEVITQCSAAYRPGQRGTWITREFKSVFSDLHKQGMVHSVEAWTSSGELAGGLYGVDAGGVFCGESMFYREPNASKLALLFLIDHMRSRGAGWLDAQVMTPHLEALGAREIPRAEFLARLAATQRLGLDLF